MTTYNQATTATPAPAAVPMNPANAPAAEPDKELDWDDAIAWEDAPAYITLPPGDYIFTVASYERGRYNGNPEQGKIACNTVRVTVVIETPAGQASAQNTFYMKKSAIGFVRDFFLCIGLIKKGQAFTPDWNAAIGRTGVAQFTTREYKGNTYNNVKKWLTE